jgi:shikimate dehydrogenase
VNRPDPTAATRLLALLGDPVAHSLSPVIQNAAMKSLQLDGVYVALRCASAEVSPAIRLLAHSGGGGNVTLPHKQTAAAAVDRRTTAVERTGACNTFWLEGGQVIGDNTDVAGFARALELFVGDTKGARVLLLGAGGAARAVVVALADAGVAAIDVITRRQARVRELVRLAEKTEVRAVPRLAERYDLIVQATPLGLHGDDPLPLDPERLHDTPAVMDLVYRPGGTRWVHSVRAAGARAVDGMEMLLQQAGESFTRWWGRPAPLDVMRNALRPPNVPAV